MINNPHGWISLIKEFLDLGSSAHSPPSPAGSHFVRVALAVSKLARRRSSGSHLGLLAASLRIGSPQIAQLYSFG
jgi:hypothetical protein